MALAEQADVESALGRDLTDDETARLDYLLGRASSIVKATTRQRFEADSETIVLRINNGKVRLPQRPVIAITAVKALLVDGTPGATLAGWYLDGIDTLNVRGIDIVINGPSWYDGWPRTVQVDYSFGYETIPADIVEVVAGMVARSFTAPGQAAGVITETIGTYSYRLADGIPAGDLYLTENDKAVLEKYTGGRARTLELHP